MTGICNQAERVMLAILWIVLTYPFSFFRPRHDLALEVMALRHQLVVLKRQTHRPKLHWSDRRLWIILARVTIHWRNSLLIIQPETVIGWQRAGFRMFWCVLTINFPHPVASFQIVTKPRQRWKVTFPRLCGCGCR